MIDKRWNLPGAWRGVRTALIIPGLVAAFSLPVSPVSAQTQAIILEEIVVSARKREESLHEVPNAITVLQEDDLRRRGITELNQVEKFAPNVVQTNFGQGNTGHAAVFMRGAGVQDHIITTDPSVGIYLDGVYLGRNMGANMDLMNIERVEVARGPQGSLSGRNTLGGALHIVTREPAGDNSARLDIKAGSLGRIDGHLFADVALVETLSVAVTGGVKSRNGIGKAVLIEDPDADIGEILRGFGRVALL
ncbi:MAG: TonB-dependent receptor [Gammaproteobacteria bacterium]|nr:TonB-dependent receptor [Gammaproteobacteria bacterium]